MRTEVWIDYQDDDTPTVKWANADEANVIVVPQKGETVGIRPVFDTADNDTYNLDYVVDVRHYFVQKDEGWVQEIHVMTSSTS